ncbi:MAG: hypothetical protein ILNGONEN_00342 [Syntrophorhabdaceae bacterium]|jgi:sulfatase maturation enzyme AslB (radical SAM superfamily)|nr:hypothetical protein [Syntrophorhabdaceae bacterium]MDI9560232.1 hypothetical protein [Pseudomonadota bacterium]
MAKALSNNVYYEYERSGALVIIIRASMSCNALCTHCSTPPQKTYLLPDKAAIAVKNTVMLYEELNHEYPREIDIVFHGGEPMLLGTAYVTDLAYLMNKQMADVNIVYGMQTNLLLYNDWRKLLGSNMFSWRITSSYDFFSSFRKTKDGRNYFDTWYDKVKQYQDDSGKRLYTICVLSRENVEYVEDIIREAYYLGLDIKLNYLYPAGRAIDIDKKVHLSPDEYGNAVIKAYKEWLKYANNKEFIYVQGKNFEDSIRNNKKLGCPYASGCVGKVFCVMPNGCLYNCPLCADMNLYSYGNIVTNNINYENITTMMLAEIAPEECYECGICNGGCKKDKLIACTDKTPFCGSYKKYYDVVTEHLNKQEEVEL